MCGNITADGLCERKCENSFYYFMISLPLLQLILRGTWINHICVSRCKISYLFFNMWPLRFWESHPASLRAADRYSVIYNIKPQCLMHQSGDEVDDRARAFEQREGDKTMTNGEEKRENQMFHTHTHRTLSVGLVLIEESCLTLYWCWCCFRPRLSWTEETDNNQ